MSNFKRLLAKVGNTNVRYFSAAVSSTALGRKFYSFKPKAFKKFLILPKDFF